MTHDSSVAALIVAAGRGQRFGADAPKQYASLAGQPLLRYATATFAAHPKVACVLVVIHSDDRALYDEAVGGLDLLPPVAGGATRQASVLAGLEALSADPPARVLIHDAARPLVSPALIDRVIAALEQDVFAAGFWARLTGSYPRCVTRRAVDHFIHARGDEAVERVRGLLGRRLAQIEQIRRQMRLKALLEVWLFIHIPATIALIAALTAHVVSVFYYWG